MCPKLDFNAGYRAGRKCEYTRCNTTNPKAIINQIEGYKPSKSEEEDDDELYALGDEDDESGLEGGEGGTTHGARDRQPRSGTRRKNNSTQTKKPCTKEMAYKAGFEAALNAATDRTIEWPPKQGSSIETLMQVKETCPPEAPPQGVLTTGLPPGTDPQLIKVLAAIGEFDKGLVKYEAPIAVRAASFISNTWWNCIAIYSTQFKDSFTSETSAIRVFDRALHTTSNRANSGAHAVLYMAERLIPNTVDLVLPTLLAVGVHGAARGLEPELKKCGDGESLDVQCLQAAVNASMALPGESNTRLIGQVVALQTVAYAISDGWNQFGQEDGCTVNCEPFKDTTGFHVEGTAKDDKDFTKWRAMLENDGMGFFFKHLHVTPHIGLKGKLRFLPESDRTTRRAKDPKYSADRKKESEAVIETMRGLNDKKKVEIETFDNKLYTTNLVLAAFLPKCAMQFHDWTALRSADPRIHCSYERMVHFVINTLNSEYDSAIMVWKEKVRFNLVRPTSVIKRWADKKINTWSPYKTESTFSARDFETYKRVMPHAEYPSGSACMCQTISDSTMGYLQKLDCEKEELGETRSGMVRGKPKVMDLSTMVSINMPVTNAMAPFQAGSSGVEPGKTPAEDTTLTYPSVVELAQACSRSRLDGGMHFDASISGGQELCKGVGNEGVEWAYRLIPPPLDLTVSPALATDTEMHTARKAMRAAMKRVREARKY